MKNWQPHESFCCREFLVIAPGCRSEIAPGDIQTGHSKGGQQVRGVRRSVFTRIRESGLQNPIIYLCICGSKPTPRYPTPMLYFLQMPTKVSCASELGFPSKRQSSLLSSHPVSHTLLKAHQSNSSEGLTNAAKSGHTRDKEQAFAKALATAGEVFGS